MEPRDDDVDLMRVSEAAEALAVSDSTVYRWIDAGRLPGVVRINGSVRIRRQSLREWVTAGEQAQEQPA